MASRSGSGRSCILFIGITAQEPETLVPELLVFQRVPREREFFDRVAADEMLLNDSFDHFGRDGVIPGAVGVHDGNGALFADAQALRATMEEEVR